MIGSTMRRQSAAEERMPSPASDEDVVARVRGGDRDAFGILVARHERRVHATVLSFVRDLDDAQDVVQETFVKAYQGIDGFRGGSRFTTWLYRIAVNSSKDWLRRRTLSATLSLDDEWLREIGFEPVATDLGGDPAEAAERSEMRRAVRTAVDALPEMQRISVMLHYMEGLPHQEVAEILGCHPISSRTNVCRGRKHLRELLSSYVSATG